MSVFLKALPALALAFDPAPMPEARFVLYPLIHKVSCAEGSGTAFRVGQNHWMSVAHVTGLTACEIDGHKLTVTNQDGPNDFAQADTDTKGNGFRINCHGFVPGHWYFAIGHARGMPFQTLLSVYATYAKTPDGKRVLIGPYTFIPGMSGGPVLNEAGEVVGTVNAFLRDTPISLSRELKDTAACGANIA